MDVLAGSHPIVFAALFLAWAGTGWIAGGVCSDMSLREAVAAARSWRLRLVEGMGALAQRLRLGGRSDDAPSLGEVTEMIDVVRLGLSAGLSFDAALGMYCAERAGPLSRSLDHARISWQMGLSTREDALMRVARQSGVRALEPFATAIGQALALGAPLAETLAGQSRECRAAHRADVERQIERAPVKLLIPTGTLILPALLLSILGPLFSAGGMI